MNETNSMSRRHFVAGVSGALLAGAEALRLVFFNLLENALDAFGDQPGQIRDRVVPAAGHLGEITDGAHDACRDDPAGGDCGQGCGSDAEPERGERDPLRGDFGGKARRVELSAGQRLPPEFDGLAHRLEPPFGPSRLRGEFGARAEWAADRALDWQRELDGGQIPLAVRHVRSFLRAQQPMAVAP